MRNITKIANRQTEDMPYNYFIISKQLFESIGKSINMQIQYEVEEEAIDKRLNEKFSKLYQMEVDKTKKNYSNVYKKKQADILKSNMVENVIKKNYRSSNSNNSSYSIPVSVQYKLGSLLVYLMKESCKVKNLEGFWINLITISHAKIKGVQKYVGVLKINEEFI